MVRARFRFPSVVDRSPHRRLFARRGFTLPEILLVLSLMAIVSMMGFRSMNTAIKKANVRAARVTTVTNVAKARSAAVSRGCLTVFHVSAGSEWITACKVSTVGAPGLASDTLGRIDDVASRYSVTISQTADSIMYDARGIRTPLTASVIRFVNSALTDSISVNAAGKVAR